jgi:hypothetical protein
MNTEIPTAEKLIYKILSNVKCDNEIEFLQLTEDGKEILSYLVEEVNNRTKSHVQAAWENAEIKQDIFSESGEPIYEINHLSILNAYPLENIK